MDRQSLAILGFFLAVNLVAFFAMFLDKVKSKKKEDQRISEGMLFFMATVFGSLGVYGGMFAFRHKTHKWYFLVGIPMLILQNSVFLYYVSNLLTNWK